MERVRDGVIGLAAVLIASGCSTPAGEPKTIKARSAFALIEIGASRAQVDGLLGSPVLVEESGRAAWFLQPPELGPADSPWGPGSILVEFSNGCVVAKKLNPQVR